MTRLAVLSDLHGNLLALEAVLADLEAQGAPDVTWVLGDLAAFCPWPAETVAQVQALPAAAFLQGNTDRYLVTGRRPAVPPAGSPEEWAAMPDVLAERDANFRWTVARLPYADSEFLRNLPDRLMMDVPGFGGVVAVHANARDDETFVRPGASEGEVRDCFAGLDGALVLYGHTHCPVDRTVGGVRFVNGGSVGMPLDGDPRSGYVLLDFVRGGCEVTFRRVAYDRDALLSELARLDHPARRWVGQKLRDAG
jgi:predicted phosphodiesterase